MKKLTALLPCVLLTLSANAAEKNNYQVMQKQLKIMSNIIKSSMPETGKRGSKITGVESTYLRGQGVLFTINSSSMNQRWGNFNFSMPEFRVPAAPVAPVAPVSSHREHEHEEELERVISESMETAAQSFEIAMEAFEEDREAYRDLRESQRDLSYELRDIERETRDIEYQLKRANEASKKEMKKELQKLEKKKSKLAVAQKELTVQNAKLAKKQKQKEVKREESRIEYYQGLKTTLSETFCLYGNGLKALPKDENVSVILKSAGSREGRGYKDTILVFSKKDIADCAMDKISQEKLLTKGQAYQF